SSARGRATSTSCPWRSPRAPRCCMRCARAGCSSAIRRSTRPPPRSVSGAAWRRCRRCCARAIASRSTGRCWSTRRRRDASAIAGRRLAAVRRDDLPRALRLGGTLVVVEELALALVVGASHAGAAVDGAHVILRALAVVGAGGGLALFLG